MTIMDEKNYNSFDPERLENFENEAEEIIKKLKEDAKFCQRFSMELPRRSATWHDFALRLSRTSRTITM